MIIKPSEDVPHTVHLLVEILLEAGLPPEVIQLVHGRGETVGKALVEHPEVPVISFTGSTETGSLIGETCGRMHKRLSLEMGGKNAMIVMDDADLDLALEGVLWGAFGTTGQRCTATSRLILHRKIHDRFLRRLADAAEGLRLGDGRAGQDRRRPADPRGLARKGRALRRDRAGGGRGAVTGGRRRGAGWPTVVLPPDDLRRREAAEPAGAGGDLRAGAERDPGGLVRRSGEGQQRCALRALQLDLHPKRGPAVPGDAGLDNGITYVNAPTIGAEAHLPFGGVKATGNGHREGGWEVYEFYSETKVCYVDYSGSLQRAQIDTYDV